MIEWQRQIIDKYPELFQSSSGVERYGFEVDEGWKGIISTLCESIYEPVSTSRAEIKFLEDQYKRLEGSHSDNLAKNQELLMKARVEYNKAIDELPVVFQVKEKFGGLRFYAGKTDERILSLISFAQRLSYITCERCGASNDTVKTFRIGWNKTYCLECGVEKYGKAALLDDN